MLDGRVNDGRHNAVVVVTDDVSHCGNVTPRDLGCATSKVLRECFDRLPDDEEVVKYRLERNLHPDRIVTHLSKAEPFISEASPQDGFEDVIEALRSVATHRGTASAMTFLRTS